MKNKGIWITMAGIIAIGILITAGNSLFLKKQQDATTTAAYESGLNEAAPREEAAAIVSAGEDGGLAEAETTAGAGGNIQSTVPETQVISPLETTAADSADMPAAPAKSDNRIFAVEETKVNYRNRLDEVSLQIQRIRSEETESTSYSMKTAAENELKLWDNELNAIYNDILLYLSEEETMNLVAEEREWMKERDAKAVEAAKKSAGGTLEGLEYTASLAESTRVRAYELAEVYERVTE